MQEAFRHFSYCLKNHQVKGSVYDNHHLVIQERSSMIDRHTRSWHALFGFNKGVCDMKKVSIVLAAVMAGSHLICGCKPYKAEKYEEVKNHETAFVIPYEGDLTKQKRLKSLDALKSFQVSPLIPIMSEGRSLIKNTALW